MSKLIISVDPGKSGAISILEQSSGKVIEVIDMPTRYFLPRKVKVKESKFLADGKTLRKKKKPIKQDPRVVFDGASFAKWVQQYKSQIVMGVIEYVTSRPGQGVSSTFKFGEMYGAVKSAIEVLGIDYILVSPKSWQDHFGLYGENTEDKDAHKSAIFNYCVEMYPNASLFGPSGGKKDGRSDAILIGRYFVDKGAECDSIGVSPY
jgi:hypothetical protein